ncbi:TetR family transcriptional regulator [Streptomyces cellostaticus]|nr:TetR family transcriptional regulator [Streptomyces cellostaticus]
MRVKSGRSAACPREAMMPAARESLLDAAYTALARRPWSAVRMVDVAAAAGVSRQTLYNEFGSKEGLARALVRREADGYLAGVERALATHTDPCGRLTAAAEWTASAARDNALVRAMLTGCWSERLPAPTLAAVPSSSAVPAQRRADGPLPSPGDLVRIVRDRAVMVLGGPGTAKADDCELARSCEFVVRLALSCVAAPPGEGGIAELVRGALPGQVI